jgi:signal transduction histidine kinase
VSEFEAKGRRYFTGMIHDLSDRKHVEMALRESERRLAQAQKLEAVGQLTGGIAHDFNNLLLVITGNLELLETRVDGDDARALLKEAQNAAVRASQHVGDSNNKIVQTNHAGIELPLPRKG